MIARSTPIKLLLRRFYKEFAARHHAPPLDLGLEHRPSGSGGAQRALGTVDIPRKAHFKGANGAGTLGLLSSFVFFPPFLISLLEQKRGGSESAFSPFPAPHPPAPGNLFSPPLSPSSSPRARSPPSPPPGASPAPHLDPATAGFRGFDPLGLAANRDLQKWMVEGELTNGRWAMAAVAGILFTDLFGLGDWWTAGAKPTPIPLTTLVAIETAVFAFLEAKRYESWKKTGYGGVAGIAPFDPLGMDSPEMREKEVRNGRLAMLAFLGFSSVAAIRGLGPIEALKLHLGNPNVENIYTTKVGGETF